MLDRFAAAWRFLTVFPFPGRYGEGGALGRSLAMFPVVGAVLGGLAWLVATALGLVLPPLPLAMLVVAAMALFSFGLHMDGLADCADALLSLGRSRERALEVMRDSRIGAHGALALCLVLLLKVACLASMPVAKMALAALAAPVAGRAAMFFPMLLLPYLRDEGLGKIFARTHAAPLLAYGVAAVAALSWAALGVSSGGVAVGAWAFVVALWVYFLRRRLGGATGDCYGAACELGEAAFVLGAAVVI